MVSQSDVLTRATPAQEVALQKAARAIGAVVTRFPSTAKAKFVATAPQLAVVWVCNPDGSYPADGDEEKLDGADEQQNTGSPVARRVVVARPLGGVA